MRSDRAAFEVVCASCQVTFPVETKKCVHCGARTSPSSDHTQSIVRPAEFGSLAGDTDVQLGEAVEPEADPLETLFDKLGERARDRSEPAETVSEETARPGPSMLGSMGSLIWIAALILFSVVSRTCGG